MIGKAAKWFVRRTKPFVWRVASAYDIRVDKRAFPYGRHPVLFENPSDIEKIPRSIYFNTASGTIYVGANTVFGEFVLLLTGKHLNHTESCEAEVPLHHVPETGRDIHIGRNCYIGSGAIIIGPVRLGDNAVVGAGAVVTKDVAAGARVAGNPARPIGSAPRTSRP